jgi:arylsulfatase A
MLLVHDPFVPTPDSPEWQSLETRSEKDNKYFVDMVAYMDKIIGKIVDELETQGIAENTLLLFVGDNGTHPRIISQTENGSIKGGKGNTISHGVNVPMLASWPSIIKRSRSYSGLTNFNDFYATFTDILSVENDSDGESLVQILKNKETSKKETVSIYYDPMWSQKVNQFRNVFTQNNRYKLYQNGDFFNLERDILETNPLNDLDLSENEKRIKIKLSSELELIPQLPKK